MPRSPTRPALALLGALLCLAACAPTATVNASATATTLPASTATPTPVLAPTPTNFPSGWQVLATTHFSLAYPPDWTAEPSIGEPAQLYTIWAPAKQSAVQVIVQPQADVATYLTPYCLPQSSSTQPTTFANLPMTFEVTGLSNSVRVWRFANAQRTWYQLEAGDVLASAAVQEQHTAILTTFRPDNATPWRC